MSIARQSVIQILLYIWILIFLIHYTVGPKGIMYGRILRQTNEQINQEIVSIKKEIGLLQQMIDKWHKIPFFKEQLAREQLQLAYPGDTIYYVT